jgi:hypothetical protein
LLWLFWRWLVICPGWPPITILPISVSQVTRIIGTRHPWQAWPNFLTVAPPYPMPSFPQSICFRKFVIANSFSAPLKCM